MKKKSIITGVTLGTATGVLFYSLSRASNHKKHSLKRKTGKALKAAGAILDEFTSMVM